MDQPEVEDTAAADVRRATRRWAVMVYLVLAYAWAWGLWGYWIPAMPATGLQMTPAFLVSAILGGLGPSLAAFLVYAIGSGWRGVATLLTRLLAHRAPLPCYLIAVLLVPTLTIVSLLIQRVAVGPLHWGDPAVLLPIGIVWPLMAALGEEFGWRGLMLPRLAPRHGLLRAAVLVGIAWGFWHLPADYIALKGYGSWFWAAFVLQGPVLLTAHSVIMAWLWKRSRGNLLVAMLYHASITAPAILAPVSTTRPEVAVAIAGLNAALVWAVAMWIIAAHANDFRPGMMGIQRQPSS